MPRRLGVIGIAVAIIVAAGLWSTRPAPRATSPTAAQPPSVLAGPYSLTYDFVTPSLGWVLAVDYRAFSTRAWLFKTVDGGAHWERQYTGRALGDRTFLQFFDEQRGFAYAGYTYRTIDGGDHWQTVDVPGKRPYVSFSSALYGWAEVFAPPRLYRTIDGGKSWAQIGPAPASADVLPPTATYENTTFRLNCEGWLGAGGIGVPVVYLTTDCGTTWGAVEVHAGGPIRPDAPYMTSVRLIGPDTVVVFMGPTRSRLGSAVLSSDFGKTWVPLALPDLLDSPSEISLVDRAAWWMFREGRIYTTDDAGASWKNVDGSGLPPGWNFESGRGIDHSHAWLSLISSSSPDLQSLAATSDGGAHWQLVSEPVP